jgi:hypothetical protein
MNGESQNQTQETVQATIQNAVLDALLLRSGYGLSLDDIKRSIERGMWGGPLYQRWPNSWGESFR